MAARRQSLRRPDENRGASAPIRHLLSLDAKTLLLRLRSRQDEMLRLFSRHRDRAPLLSASHTLWASVSFDALATLTPAEQRAAVDFYEQVVSLRWYLQYTEDMPSQMRTIVGASIERLEAAQHTLEAVLGPIEANGAPVIDSRATKRRSRRA